MVKRCALFHDSVCNPVAYIVELIHEILVLIGGIENLECRKHSSYKYVDTLPHIIVFDILHSSFLSFCQFNTLPWKGIYYISQRFS